MRTRLVSLCVMLGFAWCLDNLRNEEADVFNLKIETLKMPPIQGGRGPVFAKTPFSEASTVDIAVDVLPTEDNYPNILQTSDGEQALRLELTRPTTLNIAYSGKHYLKVTDDFSLGQWHHIEIKVRKADYIKIWVDGQLKLSNAEPAITANGVEFGNFALGTGFTHARDFVGFIRGFRLAVSFIKPQPRWKSFGLFVISAVLASAVASVVGAKIGEDKIRSFEALRVLDMLGFAAVCGAIGLWLTHANFPLDKWNILVCLLPVVLLPIWLESLEEVEGKKVSKYLQRAFSIIGIAAGVWFLWSVCQDGVSAELIINYIALLFVIWFVRCKGKLAIATILTLISLCAGLSMLTIPNAMAMEEMFRSFPAEALCVSVLILSLCLNALLGSVTVLEGNGNSLIISRLRSAVDWVPYLIFLLFAFRCDARFESGSQFHWEYYVGPIRTIRNGGWLLWDTPSQYGFLNVLLASVIPIKSAWEAFFVFQGLILFCGAVLFYWTVCGVLKLNRWLSTAIVCSAYFMADPALIGPGLYPSSSAMRFIGCYLLIFLAAKYFAGDETHADRFVKWGSFAWFFSILWSAESAIYATCIFIAPSLIAQLWRPKIGGLTRVFIVPAKVLAVGVGLIVAFYIGRLHHIPDIRMYFQYGFAYARGFGSVNIGSVGPIWLIIILMGIGASAVKDEIEGRRELQGSGRLLFCVMAATWSCSSYYLGRAVPENITALLPLLILASMIIVLVSLKSGKAACWASLALIVPLLLVSFGSTLIGLVTKTPSLSLGSPFKSVDSRLPIADTALSKLLEQGGVSDASSVVYWGFAASMPRLNSRKEALNSTWLPNPLQLLEEPISDEVRVRILNRFVERLRKDGYLVEARNQNDARFDVLRNLLLERFTEQVVAANTSYRVYHYHLK